MIDVPTDNGPFTSDASVTPAGNDASATNDAAMLSEGIRIYLANETNKRAFKKDHIPKIRVHVFKYTPQRTTKKAALLDELKK